MDEGEPQKFAEHDLSKRHGEGVFFHRSDSLGPKVQLKEEMDDTLDSVPSAQSNEMIDEQRLPLGLNRGMGLGQIRKPMALPDRNAQG